MHYKNGRQAQNGDLVIGKPSYGNTVMTGLMVDIQPGVETCNATLLRPGGMVQQCVTVADFLHAEDALAWANAVLEPVQAAPAPPADAEK